MNNWQVGACIVSPNKTVVGVGYNSMPKLPSDVKPKDNGQGGGKSESSPPTAGVSQELDKLWKGRGPEETRFYETHYDTGRKFLYGKISNLTLVSDYNAMLVF